jgi:hypothetical protein
MHVITSFVPPNVTTQSLLPISIELIFICTDLTAVPPTKYNLPLPGTIISENDEPVNIILPKSRIHVFLVIEISECENIYGIEL